MGKKMNDAILNGKIISINNYDRERMPGDLQCKYCNAPLSYVKEHSRDFGIKRIIVSHYFRLKQGKEHVKGCSNTVDGSLKNIYAKHADNETITKENDKYKVRILLVDNNLSSQKSSYQNDNVDNKKRRNSNYIPSGKKSAYLSTIKSIMKLRSELDDNTEIQNKLTLEVSSNNGKTINVRWNHFYCDSSKDESYRKMLKYLKQKRNYKHSICVDGYIKGINPYNDGYYLNLLPQDFSPKDKINKVSISYYVKNKDIIEKLENHKNKRIVVYAHCKPQKETPFFIKDKEITYHNIKGIIYDENQFLLTDN